MKYVLIIVTFCISQQALGQKYYCPVLSSNGTTLKLEQWIHISEGSVLMKTMNQGKLDSLTYERKLTTTPSAVYYTDGVVTSSLSFIDRNGTVKGIRYTVMITLKPNINDSQVAGLFYCSEIK